MRLTKFAKTVIITVIWASAAFVCSAQNVPMLSKSKIGFHVIRGQGIKVNLHSMRGTNIDTPAAPGTLPFQQYDDGYVGRDSRGAQDPLNWGDVTSYWGYNNASQLNGNEITLNKALTTNSWSLENFGEENTTGFGINTYGVKGNFTLFAGINWYPVEAKSSQSIQSPHSSIADTFTYLGATPPSAPHAGLISDTGHIIRLSGDPGSNPTRALLSNVGMDTINGTRSVDGLLHQIQFGGEFSKTYKDKYQFGLGGGITANIFNADFEISHSVFRNGIEVNAYDSNTSETDFNIGFLGSGSFAFLLEEGTQIYIQWQKQFMSDNEISQGTVEPAVVSYDDFHNVNIGMRFQF